MSRTEDDDNEDKEGGQEEGWHHGSGEVALFCLMLRQAIFKGSKLGTEKGKTIREGGKEPTEDAVDHFLPSDLQKKGRTLMCLSRLKSVFNVCLCSFSK